MAKDEDWALLDSLEPNFSEVDELAEQMAIAKFVLECKFEGADAAEVAELKAKARALLELCNKSLLDLDMLDHLKDKARKQRQIAEKAAADFNRADAEYRAAFGSLSITQKAIWIAFTALDFVLSRSPGRGRGGKPAAESEPNIPA